MPEKANRIDDPVKRKKAKKRCRKKFALVPPPAYVPPPPPPTPLALTESEVANWVRNKASLYCQFSPSCTGQSGIYVDDTGQIVCSSKSTYSWSCDGWIREAVYPPHPTPGQYICDFREVVERDGYNGIKSEQDLSFGWDCVWVGPVVPPQPQP